MRKHNPDGPGGAAAWAQDRPPPFVCLAGPSSFEPRLIKV